VFSHVPDFIASKLFRSFDASEAFLEELAELRIKNPDKKFIFLVFDAGVFELLAFRYFLRKRWGNHFVIRRALGYPGIFVNPIRESIKRFISWTGLSSKRYSLARLCKAELDQGHPLLINLPIGFRAGKIASQERLLEYLMESSKGDLLVVPLVFIWRRVGRKVEIKEEDLSSRLMKTLKSPLLLPWYFLLGDPQRPLGLRKFIMMLRGYSRSILRIATVVEVSKETSLQSVRRESIRAIQKEKRVALGPVYKPSRGIWEQILRNPDFLHFIEKLSLEENISEKKLLKKAQGILKEIAADYSHPIIELAGWLLEKVFHSIYQGFTFDRDQLKKVRETSKDGVIVYVPNHRSYLDFLVLSYFLFREQMVPPHVAAGLNLNFWPIGNIFKGGGAFFIRRSFRGDRLYSEILRTYVLVLMNNKINLEFFIEGMRSRVGKMTPPKYGILKMIVDGHLQGKVSEKIYFVPVSITYDRVTEDQAHKRELEGGAKIQENAFNALWGSIKVLLKRYGRVHLRFGNPLSLEESIQEISAHSQPDQEDFSRWIVPRIAFEICHQINQQTPVTAAGLVSTVLIARTGAALSRDELEKWLSLIESDLTKLGISKEPELELSYKEKCSRALKRLIREEIVQEYPLQDGGVGLRIVESHRMTALYYRNTALHAFLLPAIWGLSQKNIDRALELRSLLRFEFFFQNKDEFIESIKKLPLDMPFDFYAYLLQDVLESIYVCLQYLTLRKDLLLDEKEWASRLLNFAHEKLIEGEIRRRESVNTHSIKAFIEMAKNEKWLELRQDKVLGVSLKDSIASTSELCKKFLGSFVEWNRVKESCLSRKQNELRV
jgi:glycerol-3-phosphate O-acyltransferase